MITSGLSLDQAPPISVPFRFFLAAPFFGMMGCVFFFFSGAESFHSRWGALVLSFTHLVGLGFLMSIVIGALFQILPVLVGSPVRQVKWVAQIIFWCQLVGTLSLSYALATSDWSWARYLVGFLIVGFFVFALASFDSLRRARAAHETVRGLKLAMAGLLMTMVLGLLLVLGHNGVPLALFRPELTNFHLMQAWLSWFFILIVSVSYQIIPTFYVTQPFPKTMRVYFLPSVFALVALNLFCSLYSAAFGPVCLALIRHLMALPVLVYGLVLLRLIHGRRRKAQDKSLRFWITGVWLSFLALLVWFFFGQAEVTLGVLVFSAIAAVVLGMLQKIVPFLVWFHLQAKAQVAAKPVRVPNMSAIVSARSAAVTYWLFVVAVLNFLAASFGLPLFGQSAGFFGFFLFFSVALSVSKSWKVYLKESQKLAVSGVAGVLVS